MQLPQMQLAARQAVHCVSWSAGQHLVATCSCSPHAPITVRCNAKLEQAQCLWGWQQSSPPACFSCPSI